MAPQRPRENARRQRRALSQRPRRRNFFTPLPYSSWPPLRRSISPSVTRLRFFSWRLRPALLAASRHRQPAISACFFIRRYGAAAFLKAIGLSPRLSESAAPGLILLFHASSAASDLHSRLLLRFSAPPGFFVRLLDCALEAGLLRPRQAIFSWSNVVNLALFGRLVGRSTCDRLGRRQ